MTDRLPRFLCLTFCVLGSLMPCQAATSEAADFPTRPVRLINPFAPSGGIDLLARMLAQRLQESWGQSVIVDNRPGAGTNIGTELAVRASPDGYTLLLTSAVFATNVTLYRLPFDPVKDLAPVSFLAQLPFVFAVNPTVQAKSISDLISLAKKKPGQFAFGSAGAGTTTHLMLELFKSMAKVDILHVPYKGSGPAMTALLGGEVHLIILPVTLAMPQARAGKIRALAVSSAKRVELAPDLPSVAEAGLPDFDVIGWYAMFAPSATPRTLINRINAAANSALQYPAMRERMLSNGIVPVGGPPEALRDHVRIEIARWAKVIKESNIQPEE